MSKSARSAKAARDLVMAAVGASGHPEIASGFAYFHFTPARTRKIIERTKFPNPRPKGSGLRGKRFRSLRYELGDAARGLTRVLGPTRNERVKHLQQIEEAAGVLLHLLETQLKGRRIWSETQIVSQEVQQKAAAMLGKSVLTQFGGVLDKHFFPNAVRTIEELAATTRKRIEANRSHGDYDPTTIRRPGSTVWEDIYPRDADLTEYVGELAVAYYHFFQREPGISTSGESRRSGPFVRFVQAASELIGLNLSPDQIRNRFREWKGRYLKN